MTNEMVSLAADTLKKTQTLLPHIKQAPIVILESNCAGLSISFFFPVDSYGLK
jgi:hypothetical protein